MLKDLSKGSGRKQQVLNMARLIALFLMIPGVISNSVFDEQNDGSCYRIRFKDNKCGTLLRSGTSRERCCKSHYRRAWSPSGASINNSILIEGAVDEELPNQIYGKRSTTCIPCYTSCEEIKCDEDQKCVIRHGLPKCVCNPKCHLQHKAAVCGTDGRTYVSECHLLKRSCRKRQRLLVAHSGPCQTCSGVRCGSKKSCVLDELLTPLCTRCPKSCSESSMKRRSICGTDDITYPSKCALKVASCKAGMTINKAYKGPCKKDADCSNVKCWHDETCLVDHVANRPRCTFCGDLQDCPSTSRFICASDGSTFQSWCAFKHSSCRSKKALMVVPLRYCASNSTKITAVESRSSEKCASSKYGERNKQRKKNTEINAGKRNYQLKYKRNMMKVQFSEPIQPGASTGSEVSTAPMVTRTNNGKQKKKPKRRKKKTWRKDC